jgi:hypothetical protein
MNNPITSYFDYILAGLILIGRLGDILSTYYATPKLVIESNIIARKFRWPFAALTLLVCVVPFYSTPLGILILVPTFLVCFSNISQLALIKLVGENDFKKIIIAAINKHGIGKMLFFLYLSNMFIMSIGLLGMLLSSATEWGYWIGFGIVLFSMALLLHKTIFLLKLSKEARNLRYSITISEA